MSSKKVNDMETFAKVRRTIWRNPGFIGKSAGAQRLYIILFSSARLSSCGISPYLPAWWAELASDTTEADIQAALVELEEDGNIVIDHTTQEVLIVRYPHHDGWLRPRDKMVTNMWRNYSNIYSFRLRQIFVATIPDEFFDEQYSTPEEAYQIHEGFKASGTERQILQSLSNPNENEEIPGQIPFSPPPTLALEGGSHPPSHPPSDGGSDGTPEQIQKHTTSTNTKYKDKPSSAAPSPSAAPTVQDTTNSDDVSFIETEESEVSNETDSASTEVTETQSSSGTEPKNSAKEVFVVKDLLGEDHVLGETEEQRKEREKREQDAKIRENVEIVFEAWKKSAEKSDRVVLDKKREKLIRNALADYSLEDVLDAVDGWRFSPFHSGQNDQNKKYNDLELLLRNSSKIETFCEFKRNPKVADGVRVIGDHSTAPEEDVF